MNGLYLIMENLLKNEFNIKSIICVLNALEKAYAEEEYIELRYVINTLLIDLNYLAEGIRANISSLDNYIINNR